MDCARFMLVAHEEECKMGSQAGERSVFSFGRSDMCQVILRSESA
jgi:hypothetical protein